jgi:hypothetical protein
MKKLSETYKELGIAFSFPIEIKDANGKETYYEDSEGFWRKYEYDYNGKETYFENSNGYWEVKKGKPRSSKSCEGKVIEVDGKKYKLTEL